MYKIYFTLKECVTHEFFPGRWEMYPVVQKNVERITGKCLLVLQEVVHELMKCGKLNHEQFPTQSGNASYFSQIVIGKNPLTVSSYLGGFTSAFLKIP
jgi:hypothetical protein